MERGCVVMASREERLEIQGYEASISCYLYPALEAVAYTPQDDGVRKDYVLSSTGELVSIVPLKGQKIIMRGTGERPFDLLVASSSYNYAERGLLGLLSGPDALLLRYADVMHPGADSFTVQMAEEVADHVRSHTTARRLMFACDAGFSRSAALAAACLRSRGSDDWCIWSSSNLSPNFFVYRLQLAAFGIEVTEEEALSLRAMSDEAMAARIRSTYDTGLLGAGEGEVVR
jgi:hypothetical protein